MLQAGGLRSDEKVVLEHVSHHGPTTTHLRGSLLDGNLLVIKEAGFYERYLALLEPAHRDTVTYALAASWLPLEVGLAHCDACDRLFLDEAKLAEIGELTCARVLDSFLGTLLRTARSAGLDPVSWIALKQSGRVWDRLYMGGGCAVIQTGPKDVVFELYGNPMSSSRFFRATTYAFIGAISQALSRATVVKPTRPRTQRPHGVPLLISWV